MPLGEPCPTTGKTSYTFIEARKRARITNKHKRYGREGAVATPYHCRSCGFAHYGNRPTGEEGRRRRKRAG